MVLRILILVLILWLALEVGFRLLRRLLKSGVRKAMENAARNQGRSNKPSIEGELVRCDRCGVRIPRARALTRRGKTFCSEDCREAILD